MSKPQVMCTRVALHPHGGWKLSQGWQGTVVLCLQGWTSHINKNPQWVPIMVTHLQGGNVPITSTGPLLHCPVESSGIWPIFTIPLQLWKMLLYHRGWVLYNYSKPLVVIMVPNPALVDTWHCQKPIIIPLRFWPLLSDLPLSTPI